MGHEAGMMTEEDIPEFLAELGKTVAESGMDFNTWNEKHPDGIENDRSTLSATEPVKEISLLYIRKKLFL